MMELTLPRRSSSNDLLCRCDSQNSDLDWVLGIIACKTNYYISFFAGFHFNPILAILQRAQVLFAYL